MTWLLFVVGGLIGAVLGLTGAGGGILAVPALVNGLGWPLQQATPVALIAIAIGAGIGAIEGLRRGIVRYRAAILMALASLPFTTLGFRAAQQLPQSVLLLIFATVVLLVAVRLLRGDSAEAGHDPWHGHINPATGRFDWNWTTALVLGGIGVFSGFTTGLLGVGGGFVIVPALRRFTDMDIHAIVATSLLTIALISCGGILVTLQHGATLAPALALPFAAGTALGMAGGRVLARQLSARYVQQGFAALLLVVAVGLVVKALS